MSVKTLERTTNIAIQTPNSDRAKAQATEASGESLLLRSAPSLQGCGRLEGCLRRRRACQCSLGRLGPSPPPTRQWRRGWAYAGGPEKVRSGEKWSARKPSNLVGLESHIYPPYHAGSEEASRVLKGSDIRSTKDPEKKTR
jgi:hypothetical protein